MSLFDLLFLVCVLASVITLGIAAIAALRGQGGKAFRIVRAYAISTVAYLAIAVAVDYFRPQRVMAASEPICLDDWCLQVEDARRASATSYKVDLRIYSTARGISQRANGAWIYLIDEQGRRYSPNPDATATPLNVRLGPEESVHTSRTFEVPPEVRSLGLITGHGGPYCGAMSVLIIGEGRCLFNRPTMIRVS